MSKRKPDSPLSATEPVFDWWRQQWLQGANPMARLQLAWMESLAEVLQFEAQYLKAIAESSQKMGDCFTGEEAPSTPGELHECYQKLVQDVTDAQMKRLEKANELSEDFRRRVWEEL
jgi:hypothetical protein